MTGDGRLTPDDLDLVLGDRTGIPAAEHAGSPSLEPGPAAAKPDDLVADLDLGSAGMDELTAGPDEPTWGARLGGAIRDHKRLTAGFTAGLLILGALGVGYVRTRPPPLDTQITATAWLWSIPGSSLSGAQVSGGMVRSQLHLQLPPGAPALTVVGYTGAGLGPAVVMQKGAEVTVTNPLTCNTIGSFATPVAPPVLHVQRTDQWGRAVSADVPLSDGSGATAVTASAVGDYLRLACVGRLADSLQLLGVRAAAAPVTGRSQLVLQLRNPTGTDLQLLAAQAVFQPADASIGWTSPEPEAGAGVMVPAGRTTTVVLAVTRAFCPTDTSWESSDGTMGEDGRRSGDFMLGVRPSPGPPGGRYSSGTALQLSAAERAAVVAALAAPCLARH